jgi:hypothetical protein
MLSCLWLPGYLVDGRAAVRVFNSGPVPNYSLVATMVNATSGKKMNRWYASVVTMPDTTIAILGGSVVSTLGPPLIA